MCCNFYNCLVSIWWPPHILWHSYQGAASDLKEKEQRFVSLLYFCHVSISPNPPSYCQFLRVQYHIISVILNVPIIGYFQGLFPKGCEVEGWVWKLVLTWKGGRWLMMMVVCMELVGNFWQHFDFNTAYVQHMMYNEHQEKNPPLSSPPYFATEINTNASLQRVELHRNPKTLRENLKATK